MIGPSAATSGPSGRFERAAQRQAEACAERVANRSSEREKKIAALKTPGGIAKADSPERVAKRLDRLTRYFAGEDLPTTKAETPEAPLPEVVTAALDRATEVEVAAKAPPEATEAAIRALEEPEPDPIAAGIVLEKIIDTADFVDVSYLEAGAIAAKAVCRIVIRNEAGVEGYGSGSMVSPRLLLTNHHVLETAEVARRSAAEFNFQDGPDGKPVLALSHGLDPDTFFAADQERDFALVAVRASESELADFGFNRLIEAEGKVVTGEPVTIIQHPRGEKKQVALRENQLVDIAGAFLHYEADTEPGSSGSPVFNDQWEVVALHHASAPSPKEEGQYVNEGIRVSALLAALGEQTLSGDQKALVDQLTTPERITIPTADRGQAAPTPTSQTALQAMATTATGSKVTIPLEVTVRVAGATVGPSAQAAAIVDPRAGRPAIGDEAIVIDPDYADRRGYDPGFLGRGKKRVPLPELPAKLAAKAAINQEAKPRRPKYELPYHHYSVVLNKERRLAFFTAVNIDGQLAYSGSRMPREDDKWFFDPRVAEEEQTGEAVYEKNPLDRGHLVRRLDPAWGRSKDEAKSANDGTFHFTNCTPQHEDFNQSKASWAGLEDYILVNADKKNFKASVFTGPVFAPDDDEYRGVQLPRQFWKGAVMVKDGTLSATGYLLSQDDLIAGLEVVPEAFSYGQYKTFQVEIKRIEKLTGLSFGELADADPLAKLETAEPWREITTPEELVL